MIISGSFHGRYKSHAMTQQLST